MFSLSLTSLTRSALFAATTCLGIAGTAQAQSIQPRAITTAIVPTAVLSGDRDFDGAPTMVLASQLRIGRGGRAVFADITFTARENGGDGSFTSIGPISFEIWRWQPSDGARFVSGFRTDPIATSRLNGPAGCGPIGCAIIGPSEDGGRIVTRTVAAGNYLNQVTFLGDTTGDDISSDQNPHGDTSIRRITFDPIPVEFSTQLVRR